MEEQRNCKNCRYYTFHYVKVHNYLMQLSEGHCTNDRVFPYRKDKSKVVESCEFWEPMELQKEERKKMIKEVLENMEKSLRDIKAILQSDED